MMDKVETPKMEVPKKRGSKKTAQEPVTVEAESTVISEGEVNIAQVIITALTDPSPLTEEAARAYLVDKYEGVIFDCTTKEGLDDARKSAALLSVFVNRGNEKRLKLNVPHRAAIEENDAIFKRMEALAVGYRDPIRAAVKARDAEIQAEKDEIARLAAARVAAFEEKLAGWVGVPMRVMLQTSAEIQEVHDQFKAVVIGEDWEDFAPRALETQGYVLEQLQKMATDKGAAEVEEAAARAANEKETARLAEIQAGLDAETENLAAERRSLEEAKERQKVADQEAQARRDEESDLATQRDLAAQARRTRLAEIAALPITCMSPVLTAEAVRDMIHELDSSDGDPADLELTAAVNTASASMEQVRLFKLQQEQAAATAQDVADKAALQKLEEEAAAQKLLDDAAAEVERLAQEKRDADAETARLAAIAKEQAAERERLDAEALRLAAATKDATTAFQAIYDAGTNGDMLDEDARVYMSNLAYTMLTQGEA